MTEAAEEESESRGVLIHLKPNGNNFDAWLKHAPAARSIGVSEKSLRRAWEAGKISRYDFGQGRVRYNPAELELFASQRQAAADEASDESDDEHTGERFSPAYVQMLQAAVAQIKDQQGHNAELIKLITGPVNNTFEVLRKTIEEVQARNADLEGKRDAMIVAREDSLSREHERATLDKMVESDGEVRRKLFDSFQKMAPRAMDHIVAGAVKTDPKKSTQVVAVLELLKTLDPKKFEAMMKMGVLTDDQADLVLKILKPDEVSDADAVVPQVPTEDDDGNDDNDEASADAAAIDTDGEAAEPAKDETSDAES